MMARASSIRPTCAEAEAVKTACASEACFETGQGLFVAVEMEQRSPGVKSRIGGLSGSRRRAGASESSASAERPAKGQHVREPEVHVRVARSQLDCALGACQSLAMMTRPQMYVAEHGVGKRQEGIQFQRAARARESLHQLQTGATPRTLAVRTQDRGERQRHRAGCEVGGAKARLAPKLRLYLSTAATLNRSVIGSREGGPT